MEFKIGDRVVFQTQGSDKLMFGLVMRLSPFIIRPDYPISNGAVFRNIKKVDA